MNMPKSKRELDAIEHHISEAQKAAGIASSYLSDAMGPQPEGVTPEQWRENTYLCAALATTATRVADSHTRLLELKLAIGDSAL
jgi:hypothetical protein